MKKRACTRTPGTSRSVFPTKTAPLPPAQLDLYEDCTVTIDVPGRRRFCKFCNGTEHTRFNCRQGQRKRAAARRLKQQEDAFLQDQDHTTAQQSDSDAETVLEDTTTDTPGGPMIAPRRRLRLAKPPRIKTMMLK